METWQILVLCIFVGVIIVQVISDWILFLETKKIHKQSNNNREKYLEKLERTLKEIKTSPNDNKA